ncbi:RagB/SusD family nutrient uptake outer membrane protein [Ohtaekwangia koreensis]|uniref:Starch-binding associating with outer membrane n=1 Tax=Ohtaekwangia koreensis TaxID=688867 RepID=A0A1T5KIN8_9BACT|nr:RagB/SusD family nutrient uptake outer membrane protein [Ohtaekwangia koreensis]SKC63587.1 Starch-binding associating with outer membrane [Ohtaekwangia koreensis]
MKTKSKIICLAIAISGFLISCGDSFLDRPALSSIMSNNFYKTSDDLKKATAALYTGGIWGQWSSECYLPLGEVLSGNMILGYNGGATQLNTFSLTGYNSNLVAEWRTMYNLIAHANTTIHAIEELAQNDIPKADVNAALGEAKFMRAYAYFTLTRLWGDVPIIEDNRDLFDNPLVHLNHASDVYQFVANDLTFARKNLPVTGGGWDKGRVTTWSAQGLLAKVYLTWAGLNHSGTRDQALLDSAKLYAGNVCEQSGLSLLDDYAAVFEYKNSDNEESLFALQWPTNGGGWYNGNMLQLYSGALIINGSGGYFGIEATYDMYLQYLDLDNDSTEIDSLRRKATFMLRGEKYSELNTNISYVEAGITKNGLKFGGDSGLKKHIIGNEKDLNLPQMTNTSSPEHTILLRLADIYLIYVEAVLGNNGTTSDAQALGYFNQIRKRAGLDEVSSIDADALFKERRVELAGEGEYWFDIVRLSNYNPVKALGLLNCEDCRSKISVDGETGKVTPGGTYEAITPATANTFKLPIPSDEITANPYLLQPAVPYSF